MCAIWSDMLGYPRRYVLRKVVQSCFGAKYILEYGNKTSSTAWWRITIEGVLTKQRIHYVTLHTSYMRTLTWVLSFTESISSEAGDWMKLSARF